MGNPNNQREKGGEKDEEEPSTCRPRREADEKRTAGKNREEEKETEGDRGGEPVALQKGPAQVRAKGVRRVDSLTQNASNRISHKQVPVPRMYTPFKKTNLTREGWRF